MKQNERSRNIIQFEPRQPKYPNAADDRYFTTKALDILTAVVSGMGLLSAMLFLVTLS
jgi:hypothetical protein